MPFKIISSYFWLIAISFTLINFAYSKREARIRIEKNPELAEGYDKLLRGYLLWMNLPWMVMGICSIVGKIPSVWYFFRPRDGNPYVLTWFGCLIFEWIISAIWIFFKGGAEKLVEYPGILRMRGVQITNPVIVKLLFLAGIGGGIFGLVLMWQNNFPIPNF